MKTALKYWHTVRHLRAVQLYGRIWFRVHRPRPDHRPAPDLRGSAGRWKTAIARSPCMVGEHEFVFLNEPGKVGGAADWNNPDKEKLWLYNLHYFDDLNAQIAASRKTWHTALLADWVMDNTPGEGNGWEPYPLSLRIVNWIKWALAGNELTPDLRHSLAVQTRYLRARLEHHLLGNHLFANAKALVFAGLFFNGDEADAWVAKGLGILAREIPEQILADGGHFELSPMYHAIILEDILDMINLARTFLGEIEDATVDDWCKVTAQMMGWLAAMSHPDGEISFFNDAAFGIAGTGRELAAYGGRLDLSDGREAVRGMVHLAQSGYIRVEQADVVALLDVARIGPDYLPGHAHADTLSFEMSVLGQRLFVNSGTSQYGNAPERLRQRSTRAHNTLELDRKNSSEVWSGFRVARRARPVGLEMSEHDDKFFIACAHDGYQRLGEQSCHKRMWHFKRGSLSVVDEMNREAGTSAIARYHLHPEVKAKGNEREGHFILGSGECISWNVEGGTARISTGTWHPEFGRSVANQCLEVTMAASHCSTIFSW